MTSRTRKSLNIITALACEAKPLIDHYRLRKLPGQLFDWFDNAGNEHSEFNINLVVSGIGTINMANAVGWLGAKTETTKTVWLNVGTAGSESLPLGTLCLAHRISDEVNESVSYPPIIVKWLGTTLPLITHRAPVTEYPPNIMVDMEASAFAVAAPRFASRELVQCIKVISDNAGTGTGHINPETISELIAPHVKAIESYSMSLIELIPERGQRSNFGSLITHLHNTASQRRQFDALLDRLQVLEALDDKLLDTVRAQSSMREVLALLSTRLDTTVPSLGKLGSS